MNKVIYTSPRTYEKYDNKHYIVYLNEEIIPNYVPETYEQENPLEPITAYAYTGKEKDGGTLIEVTSTDRNSLINGIIRSYYTQSEEDAIKTHQIELLKGNANDKAAEYEIEWLDFNTVRSIAKTTVDKWLNNNYY